jgi:hypothetical protein
MQINPVPGWPNNNAMKPPKIRNNPTILPRTRIPTIKALMSPVPGGLEINPIKPLTNRKTPMKVPMIMIHSNKTPANIVNSLFD